MEKFLSWLADIGLSTANRMVPFALIIIVGIVLVQTVLTIIKKILSKSKMEKAAHSLILSVVRIVAYVMLALVGASALGLDITGLVALASVVTLAISLALQNSLTNLIGGFTLLYTKPFKSGDYVEVAGQAGTVSEIGMAYTKLITPDNKLTYIPNASVVSAEIVNYTCTGTRRLDIAVSVSYDTPIDDVLKALHEAGSVEKILPDQGVFTAVTKYNQGTVDYVLRVWTKTEDFWDVNFLLNKRVKEIFDREGLKMAYPRLNVHLNP